MRLVHKRLESSMGNATQTHFLSLFLSRFQDAVTLFTFLFFQLLIGFMIMFGCLHMFEHINTCKVSQGCQLVNRFRSKPSPSLILNRNKPKRVLMTLDCSSLIANLHNSLRSRPSQNGFKRKHFVDISKRHFDIESGIEKNILNEFVEINL